MLDDDPVCRPGVCTDLRVRPEFAAPFAKATASNSQTATAISITAALYRAVAAPAVSEAAAAAALYRAVAAPTVSEAAAAIAIATAVARRWYLDPSTGRSVPAVPG